MKSFKNKEKTSILNNFCSIGKKKWHQPLLIRCLVFLLALSIGEVSWTQVIDVIVSPPRGGLGDIAANLVMFDKLKAANTDSKIEFRLVVPESAKESFEKLAPSQPYQTTRSNDTSLGLTFSAVDVPKEFLNQGQVLVYFEPGDYISKEVNGSLSFAQNIRFEPTKFNWNFLRLTTGANHGGLYLSSTRPPEHSRQSVIQELALWAQQYNRGVLSTLSTMDRIGFAYVRSSQLRDNYLKAISNIAEKNGQPIWVFANSSTSSYKLSPLVRIVDTSGMPLSLTEKLISITNIPVLVTGDTSLSIALDWEKTVLYEVNSWKRISATQLISLLSTNTAMRSVLSRAFSMSMGGGADQVSFIQEYVENTDFQLRFIESLRKSRRYLSLVQSVFSDLRLLSKIDPQKMIYEGVSYAINENRRLSPSENITTRIRSTFLNERRSIEHRRLAFYALLSMKDWNSPNNLKAYIRVLDEPSPFSIEIRTFIGTTNINRSRITELLKNIWESGYPSSQKVVRELLAEASAQDPVQSGSRNVETASQILNSLEKENAISCRRLIE